ncbi:hypothetical protein OTU49_007770 [Cherax quadricarinatus]|uniref:RRM domain-containing protein n=1 Tax=Cherax quadricarinatus TaxID=27406 RepID=A0AAW0WG67_CHEQU
MQEKLKGQSNPSTSSWSQMLTHIAISLVLHLFCSFIQKLFYHDAVADGIPVAAGDPVVTSSPVAEGDLLVKSSHVTVSESVAASDPVVTSSPEAEGDLLVKSSHVTVSDSVAAGGPVVTSSPVAEGDLLVKSSHVTVSDSVAAGDLVVTSSPVDGDLLDMSSHVTVSGSEITSSPANAGDSVVTSNSVVATNSLVSVESSDEEWGLFIRNMPLDYTEEKIKELFHGFDGLYQVVVPPSRKNKSRGFAFAFFINKQCRDKALLLDGSLVFGKGDANARAIQVECYCSKSPFKYPLPTPPPASHAPTPKQNIVENNEQCPKV